MNRSDTTPELMRDPLAFTLLAQIAYRARWRSGFNQHGLQAGEAMIGDFRSVGMTEREYRTRTARLVKWGFVTTEPTPRGTIAKLVSTEVFDLSSFKSTAENDDHNGGLPTNSRRPNDELATDKRRLTNKGNHDNKANKETLLPLGGVTAEAIYEAYPRKVAKPDALKAIRRAIKKHSGDFLLKQTKLFAKLCPRPTRYTPHPATWFNGERFNDSSDTWLSGEAAAVAQRKAGEYSTPRDTGKLYVFNPLAEQSEGRVAGHAG